MRDGMSELFGVGWVEVRVGIRIGKGPQVHRAVILLLSRKRNRTWNDIYSIELAIITYSSTQMLLPAIMKNKSA